ncbi:MAG: squalene/phytoene synthase family protein [Pseudomonadota bacterium]
MQSIMIDNSLEIVRNHDPDRFLLAITSPIKHRKALFAVYALNYELAKTSEVVSDPMIGHIRLQWWKDAIHEIFDGQKPRQHEVVEPLAKCIKQYDLQQKDFHDLIDARKYELDHHDCETAQDFEAFARSLHHSILKITCDILGQEEEHLEKIAQLCSIVGLIRNIPAQLNQRKLYFPKNLLENKNLSLQNILDFRKEDQLCEIIFEYLQTLEFSKDFKATSKIGKKSLKLIFFSKV